jgi:hypothetical protein
MSIKALHAIVSTPELFFCVYLTLVNTFLAISHGPLDPVTRYEFSETYVAVLSSFALSMFLNIRPQALPLIQALANLIQQQETSSPPQMIPKSQYYIEECSSCSD